MRQRRLDELSRIRMKRSLLDVLAEHATFGPPDVLVDQEFDQIWKNLETSRTNGTLDDDDKAKSEDQLKTDYRAIAMRRVRLGLMLGEIGRINNIQVTQDELTAAIRQEASRYPGQEARMMEFYRGYPAAMDALRGPIFEDKVIDYILDAATVSDVEISVAELEKDPEEAPAGTLVSGEAAADQAPVIEAPVVEAAVVEAAVIEEAIGAAPAAPAA